MTKEDLTWINLALVLGTRALDIADRAVALEERKLDASERNKTEFAAATAALGKALDKASGGGR